MARTADQQLSDYLPPLLCVPPPLLTIILQHLDGRDLARVSTTCRSLQHGAVQDSLWRPLLKQLVFRVLMSGPSRLRPLFAKDTSIYPLLQPTWASSDVSFMSRYREKMLVFQAEQRRQRARINLANEMKALRRRLIYQRKPYSDRFDKWQNCLVGNEAFRFFFYVPAIFLPAFLIMLHARLSYAPTLPMLAVWAPVNALAVISGMLWLATAILYLPTFRCRDDRVLCCLRGCIVLARRSVELSAMFLGHDRRLLVRPCAVAAV